MKKAIKITLLVLALVCTVTAFTGCSDIDDLRAHRMDWSDSKHTAIEFNGKTYKKLPDSEYFDINTVYDYNYFVCNKDVPLLLARGNILGTSTFVTEDKTIINVNGDYYALEDKYEYYKDIIENCEFDRYCAYVGKFDKDGNYYSELKVFDEKLSARLDAAIEAKIEENIPENTSCYTDMIYRCDSTGLMTSDWIELYCCEEAKSAYINFENKYFRLPDEYYDDIKSITDINKEINATEPYVKEDVYFN